MGGPQPGGMPPAPPMGGGQPPMPPQGGLQPPQAGAPQQPPMAPPPMGVMPGPPQGMPDQTGQPLVGKIQEPTGMDRQRALAQVLRG